MANSNFDDEIALLNDRLISIANAQAPLGLLSGKMGCCIYFYKVAKFTGNIQYKKTAELLLDSVCNSLKHYRSWDLENGLSGIGIGIDYLVREKFITGNINKILREFDIAVFKLLLFPHKDHPVDLRLKIQLLYYYCIRIKSQKKGSDDELIIKELIFEILNSITLLPNNFFEEPYSFSIDFRLPFFLFTLGAISRLEIFRNKVKKIADEITSEIVSKIPVLHSHRLYLMWGMQTLTKEFNLCLWENHLRLLSREIDTDYMFAHEFRDRNVFLKDGISGILFLLTAYNNNAEYSEKVSYSTEYVRSRLLTSKVWEQLLTNKQFFRTNSSLNGFCGVALAIMSLRDIYQ